MPKEKIWWARGKKQLKFKKNHSSFEPITVFAKTYIILMFIVVYIMEQNKLGQWVYPNLPPKPFIYDKPVSLIDFDDERSALNTSQIRGLFNLSIIFMTIFFITQPIVNFIENGYFIDKTLYNTFKRDLFFCLFNWPLFFAWYF